MDDSPAPAPPQTLPEFAPVPRQCDRSNGWKPEVQRAFIEALADTGSVASACRHVRRSTRGAYHLRRQPGAESFRKAWEAAVDLGIQRIEDVAMDRALNGIEVPVYSHGKLVGSRTSFNDRLLMFMLRNRASGRFAEGKAKGMNAVGKMELERLPSPFALMFGRLGLRKQANVSIVDTSILFSICSDWGRRQAASFTATTRSLMCRLFCSTMVCAPCSSRSHAALAGCRTSECSSAIDPAQNWSKLITRLERSKSSRGKAASS